MPSQQNTQLVQEATDRITRSKSVIVVEYQGLSVKDQVTLRAALKAAGGELIVCQEPLSQNRSYNPASKTCRLEIDEALNGPSAILYGYDDAVAATKALMDFAKDHETIKAKVGVLDG
jgi:large subunit ribosomal protein L10